MLTPEVLGLERIDLTPRLQVLVLCVGSHSDIEARISRPIPTLLAWLSHSARTVGILLHPSEILVLDPSVRSCVLCGFLFWILGL